jgi:hypothetical protein
MEPSVLLTPWFWVGLSLVAAAGVGAWLAGHSRSTPAKSGRVGGRPETRHERAEYLDDPWIR